MTLYEVLKEAGINEDEISKAVGRFGGNEMLYRKFLQKFLKDENFRSLERAVEDKDYKNAEIYAHTLKGVALNLGLNTLAENAKEIVDHIRNKAYDKIDTDFERCEDTYNKVISWLVKLN